MGATIEQDFAINFLAALYNIWAEQSGTFQVAETEDFLPALAQITTRWLAATARERADRQRRDLVVRGNVQQGAESVQPTDAFRNRRDVQLREALNSIIHAEPDWVSVQDGEVIVCWKYTPRWNANPETDRPYCAYFLADSLIAAVRSALYSEKRRLRQVSELDGLAHPYHPDLDLYGVAPSRPVPGLAGLEDLGWANTPDSCPPERWP
jgi:hypothetical protein